MLLFDASVLCSSYWIFFANVVISYTVAWSFLMRESCVSVRFFA